MTIDPYRPPVADEPPPTALPELALALGGYAAALWWLVGGSVAMVAGSMVFPMVRSAAEPVGIALGAYQAIRMRAVVRAVADEPIAARAQLGAGLTFGGAAAELLVLLGPGLPWVHLVPGVLWTAGVISFALALRRLGGDVLATWAIVLFALAETGQLAMAFLRHGMVGLVPVALLGLTALCGLITYFYAIYAARRAHSK